MSGLMAALSLRGSGASVMVLDKGRSVGGRMATRRIGPGQADHGAQFLTVRNETFGAWAKQWLDQGWLFEWSRGWSDGSLRPSLEIGYPRFAAVGGMNALAKHLSGQAEQAGTHIHANVKLESVEQTADGWLARDENDVTYSAPAILLTPPVPQSLSLLSAGGVALTDANRTDLESIDYAPSLCGLFWVEGRVNLPEPGVLQTPTAPVSWIADNQRKGISPDAKLITAQVIPHMSREWWALPESETLALIQAEISPLFDPGTRIREAQLKRWRYALSSSTYSNPFMEAEGHSGLLLAGDGFGGPRLEGAAISGLSAGARLKELFGKS